MPKKYGIKYDVPLHVVAYQRSGHHGVMYWLFSQLPSPSIFRKSTSNEEFITFDNGGTSHRKGTFKNQNAVVLGENLEGCVDIIYDWVPKEEPALVVVRDIKNNIASIAKRGGHKKFKPHVWECFREYYKFALDKKKQEENNTIVVSYPAWHTIAEYRGSLFKDICGLLKVNAEFTDAGKNFVMGAGGGSSFTGTAVSADKMDVLSRYKDKKVQGAIATIPEDILELNKAFFGDIYD